MGTWVERDWWLKLEDFEAGYIAGLIDGEGTITMCKTGNEYKPHVQIANTNKEILEKTKRIIGCGWIVEYRRDGCKILYVFHVPVSVMGIVLERVLPFLVAKRTQAGLMLKYLDCRIKPGQRRNEEYISWLNQIHQDFRSLNG